MLKLAALSCVLLAAALTVEAKATVYGVKWDVATKETKKFVNDYARQWRRCINYADLEPFGLYRTDGATDVRLIFDLAGLQLPVDDQSNKVSATAVTGGDCALDGGSLVCGAPFKAPIGIEARTFAGACNGITPPAEIVDFDEAGYQPLDGTGGCGRWSIGGLARPPARNYAIGDCVQFVQKSTGAVLYQGTFVDEANLATCRTLKQCPTFAIACALGECGCDGVTDQALLKPLCVLKK